MQCWGAWSTLPTSILAPNTQCWTLVRIGKRENPKAPDHHLTTPSSQPVPFIVFYVPTFFYNHYNQHRKLCTPHNFRRWFIVFACLSQFSDARCRGFESPRPQRAVLFGRCSFLFESPNYHHNVVLYWKKRSFAFEKIGSGPHQKAHSTRVYSGRRRGFMVYWWQLTERSNRRTRLWRT